MYEKLHRKYKKLVKNSMKALEAYKPEFDTLIDVYSGMLAQYQILTQRLIDSSFNIEVETQRGGTRKSATATALERLRADLILYSDRLMLNPKALFNAKMAVSKEPSTLGKLLLEMGKEE